MAHFAKIVDGVVTQIVVVNNEVITDDNGNEQESIGQSFLNDLLGGSWVQCSYNGKPIQGQDRGGYPAVGWIFDYNTNMFAQPIATD